MLSNFLFLFWTIDHNCPPQHTRYVTRVEKRKWRTEANHCHFNIESGAKKGKTRPVKRKQVFFHFHLSLFIIIILFCVNSSSAPPTQSHRTEATNQVTPREVVLDRGTRKRKPSPPMSAPNVPPNPTKRAAVAPTPKPSAWKISSQY